MIRTILLICAISGGGQHKRLHTARTHVTLMVAEASAVVEVQEARLRTARIAVRRAELVVAHRKVRLDRHESLFKSAAISTHEYEDAKLAHEEAVLDLEESRSDVVEVEKSVKLARIRLSIEEGKSRED